MTFQVNCTASCPGGASTVNFHLYSSNFCGTVGPVPVPDSTVTVSTFTDAALSHAASAFIVGHELYLTATVVSPNIAIASVTINALEISVCLSAQSRAIGFKSILL